MKLSLSSPRPIPMSQILGQLDSCQREAAMHNEGPSLVLAGPGAGKTSTLTARVGRLIVEGLSPDRILCTTFSKAGAEEMQKRIAGILGILPDALKNTVSTFHSQALGLLTQERERLPFKLKPGREAVIEPSKIRRILRQIVNKERTGGARQFIGKMRRMLVSPEDSAIHTEDVTLPEIYFQFHQALCNEGQLDFDSMVYWAVSLLEGNQYVRANWEGRFKQVIVDEAHDTSKDQFRFAQLLARPHNNLMVVGDRSQSIYGWRGADTSVLSGDNAKAYFLGLNYRSSQEVIDLFLPLAEQDELTQKLSARMKAVTRERGSVECLDFIDESEQASAVAQSVAQSIFSGVKPESHAVLSRTRALLAQYADEFEYRGLPYRWSGKNFWLSNEVQDVLALVRLAINPKDTEAVSRIICSTMELTKYLGAKFADAVIYSAKARGVGPLDVRIPDGNWRNGQLDRWDTARNVIRGLVRNGGAVPRSFLKQVLEETGLERGGEAGEDPDDFKGENLIVLTGRAARFTNLKDFLLHAEVMAKRSTVKAGIALSTIHGSKGLEWDNVHVVGVSEDVLPHRHAEDLEEERRLLYVALSRARRNIAMSYHKKPSSLFLMVYRLWDSQTKQAVSA